MTQVERFDTGFELTFDGFHRMHAGALMKLETDAVQAGWLNDLRNFAEARGPIFKASRWLSVIRFFFANGLQ